MIRLDRPLKSGVSVVALVIGFAAFDSNAFAGALPGHGHFVSGVGVIKKSSGRLSIDQSSQTGIINWKSFSVGKANNVIFNNANGATLSRVTGNNLSRIAGSLHATGSVYLINRAGVVVSGSGRVLTGGSFVASSASADSDFTSKRLHLHGAPAGNIVNSGRIVSTSGNVSLQGLDVRETGKISGGNVSVIASGAERMSGTIVARGRVETSGESLSVGRGSVTAKKWLLDPTNLTVDSTAAATINDSLGADTPVVLHTTSSGATGPGNQSNGRGDITIAAPLSWSTDALLTLDAYHSININAAINVTGTGALTLKTNDGGTKGDYFFGTGGNVTFGDMSDALTINGTSFTLVPDIATLITDAAGNASGHYALANSYDATTDGTYDSSAVSTFSGTFEGLGNAISNLSLNDTTQGDNVGLFGTTTSTAVLRDISIKTANIKGGKLTTIGALVGDNKGGSIANAYVTGTLTGGNNAVIGGLVGYSESGGTVSLSRSAAVVNGGKQTGSPSYDGVGGLVGMNGGTISQSYATHAVTDISGVNQDTGGLVGLNLDGAVISASYATGAVSQGSGGSIGGLVGTNRGTINGSYATGAVTGATGVLGGGLVGASYGAITSSYAKGKVKGGNGSDMGGLVGYNSSTISKSYAKGTVTTGGGGNTYAGGLIGTNSGSISMAYSTGAVTGGNNSVQIGGFVGLNGGKIIYAYSVGAVKAGANDYVGGFAGSNIKGFGGHIASAYEIGAVKSTGGKKSYLGGFVGYDPTKGDIRTSYWDVTTSGVKNLTKGAGNVANDKGITGISSAKLKKGLPAGFAKAKWALSKTKNRGFPYLKALSASY